MKKPGEDGRWIRTEWAVGEKHLYHTGIKVSVHSQVGAISEVLSVLTNMKIAVTEMSAKAESDGHSDVFLTITVNNREQLELVLSRIGKVRGVIRTKRLVAGDTED